MIQFLALMFTNSFNPHGKWIALKELGILPNDCPGNGVFCVRAQFIPLQTYKPIQQLLLTHNGNSEIVNFLYTYLKSPLNAL